MVVAVAAAGVVAVVVVVAAAVVVVGLVEAYDLPPFFPCFIVPNAPGMV